MVLQARNTPLSYLSHTEFLRTGRTRSTVLSSPLYKRRVLPPPSVNEHMHHNQARVTQHASIHSKHCVSRQPTYVSYIMMHLPLIHALTSLPPSRPCVGPPLRLPLAPAHSKEGSFNAPLLNVLFTHPVNTPAHSVHKRTGHDYPIVRITNHSTMLTLPVNRPFSHSVGSCYVIRLSLKSTASLHYQ